MSDTAQGPAERFKPAALFICTLAALAEGFDNQSMGVAAPGLIAELGLKLGQFGLVFSAATGGLFFGALLGGRSADIFGRARTLCASLALFGIFSLLTASMPNLTALLVVRFITGLGLGAAMPNFITLAAESVPAKNRVMAVAMITAAIPLGGAVSGLVALGASAGWNWRSIFWVGGGAPLIAAVLVPVLLRGAPLIAPRRRSGQVPEFAEALFGANSVTTALLWVAFLLTHLVLFSLLNWLPSLSIGLGLARHQSGWAAILFNVGGASGGVLVGLLARSDRRAVVAVTYAGTCIAIALLALRGHDSFAAFAAASFVAGLFAIGGQVTLYGLAPLCYPQASRGTGVGAALALGRLGAVVGPSLIGALLAGGLQSTGALLSVLPFVVGGGAVAYLLAGRKRVAQELTDP
jgi:MFS transporter, AAHS family, 3-hydroxyphenylpropionic acid transporter